VHRKARRGAGAGSDGDGVSSTHARLRPCGATRDRGSRSGRHAAARGRQRRRAAARLAQRIRAHQPHISGDGGGQQLVPTSGRVVPFWSNSFEDMSAQWHLLA
jgi:hypothetical protein